MNLAHRWLCNSNRWRNVVEAYVVPWTLEGLDLGGELLEIGPGYGAVTEQLVKRAPRLTCVEINCRMADDLRRRFAGVTVLCEDATRTSLPDGRFDAAVCFTMLHHVPSVDLQDKLFREAFRLLRPGGVFAGTDSKESRWMKWLHVFDDFEPVDPGTLAGRLEAVGFGDVSVDVNDYAFRFRGKKQGTGIREQGTERQGVGNRE